MGKAGVVAGQKPTEKGVGGPEVADISEVQFGQEPILKRPEEAFDATAALRRGSGDPPNPELAEDPPDLGRRGRAMQLLPERDRGAALSVEDAMPVGVGGERDPVPTSEQVEQP